MVCMRLVTIHSARQAEWDAVSELSSLNSMGGSGWLHLKIIHIWDIFLQEFRGNRAQASSMKRAMTG